MADSGTNNAGSFVAELLCAMNISYSRPFHGIAPGLPFAWPFYWKEIVTFQVTFSKRLAVLYSPAASLTAISLLHRNSISSLPMRKASLSTRDTKMCEESYSNHKIKCGAYCIYTWTRTRCYFHVFLNKSMLLQDLNLQLFSVFNIHITELLDSHLTITIYFCV